MVSVGQVVCKTIGVAGMAAAMVDVVSGTKAAARHRAHAASANYLEDAYFNSRTTDNISANSNRLRSLAFDFQTWNPLPTIAGKFKGGLNGALYSLGVQLPAIVCSALALTTKGFLSKLGAAGVVLGISYNIARNGFGLGKTHPMN